MFSSKEPRRSQPLVWREEYTIAWEECLPELRRDFQWRAGARGRDEVAGLSPDDSVVQTHPRTPRNVSIDRAHAVPDEDWEVGTTWEQNEPALRFGVVARLEYRHFESWSEDLEELLRRNW